MNDITRVRFAPSPTGYLHIGGARTALFNWLYARHEGGRFILRIEDTDQARSTEASTRAILDAMTWLGLNWDEGPFFQADRVELYRAAARKLVDSGKAFYCLCPPEELEARRTLALAQGRKPKYDGACRDRQLGRTDKTVIRFRCPDVGSTVVRDMIKGSITFNNDELDDLVIERADGYPTYNFAVVVDDIDMGITHVIRGDDHLNNTPRQILLYEALGHPTPQFGHVPMILGSDRARLSKRHGATSVMAYREMGYLPEALVNYLVRLGWSYGDQEIFSLEEMTSLFSLESVGKSAAIFNPEKLLWLNQHYLKNASIERLVEEMRPFWQDRNFIPSSPDFARQVVSDLKSRVKTLDELAEAGAFYFQDHPVYEAEAAAKYLNREGAHIISAIIRKMPQYEDLTKSGIENFLKETAQDMQIKLKVLIQPLRVALTGKTVSPGIDEVIITLGQERVMARLKHAVDYIDNSEK